MDCACFRRACAHGHGAVAGRANRQAGEQNRTSDNTRRRDMRITVPERSSDGVKFSLFNDRRHIDEDLLTLRIFTLRLRAKLVENPFAHVNRVCKDLMHPADPEPASCQGGMSWSNAGR